jgi:hypothetical protein
MVFFTKKVYNMSVMALDYIKKGETRVLKDGTVVDCTDAGVIVVNNTKDHNVPRTVGEYHEILPTQLTSKELMFVEDYMRPKRISEEGFLAPDDNLIDVYIKDKITLDRYDITFDQVYDKLKEFFEATTLAFRGLGPEYKETPRFPVQVQKYGKKYLAKISYKMEFIECPFEELREYHNVKQGKGIAFTMF